MEKTTIKMFSFMSMILTFTFGLSACSDEEHYDVKGNPNNLIYFTANSTNTLNGTIVHTPVGDFGDVEAVFPVKIQRPATKDTKVTAVIDTSLVATYNEENETDYAVISPDLISFTNATVSILKDSTIAEDSIILTIPEESYAKLTGEGYLIPVKLANVQGDGKGSEERGIGYVIITTTTTLIKTNTAADDMPGTLVTDYSDWTAYYDSGTTITASELFDGSLTNGAQLRTDGSGGKTTTVIIDMQSTRKVVGMRFCRYYYSYYYSWWDYWYYYGYYFSAVTSWYSTDGETWGDIGTASDSEMETTDGFQYVALYGAVSARYLKFTFNSGESTISSLGELGIYTE